MRALTVCQPHSAFIFARPEELPSAEIDGLTPKRVENRPQPFSHRGPLLIHAGLSRRWYQGTGWDKVELPPLVYGAFLGVVDVLDCVEFSRREAEGIYTFESQDSTIIKYPWLTRHYHAFGPHGLILANVRRFKKPIPWKGAQGLWSADSEEIQKAVREAEAIEWMPR